MNQVSHSIHIGLERVLTDPPPILRGARFGLLMNRASVDRELRFVCDLLDAAFPGQLAALFTPQHGLWGEQQANMIESPHGRHPTLDVPIHSLYSETRTPSLAMLDQLDAFVVDLQDVGCRVYTFAWTLMNCLRACAGAGIPVVLLDRPNPLGNSVEGPPLEPAFRSFVGGASIPMRHGLTLGQLAEHVNHEHRIGATLEVVPVSNCPPEAMFDQLGRLWVPPSPNLPTFASALVYPGQVLLEGTNISEGRGTTQPFEICGAPFIDERRLCESMNAYKLPGVRFLPIRFTPAFDKYAGESCGGVTFHVVDANAFRPYRTSVTLLATIFQTSLHDATWLPPPYEYETEKMPIDILSGSDRLRTAIPVVDPLDANAIAGLCA